MSVACRVQRQPVEQLDYYGGAIGGDTTRAARCR